MFVLRREEGSFVCGVLMESFEKIEVPPFPVVVKLPRFLQVSVQMSPRQRPSLAALFWDSPSTVTALSPGPCFWWWLITILHIYLFACSLPNRQELVRTETSLFWIPRAYDSAWHIVGTESEAWQCRQGLANFSLKVQIVSILGLVCHTVPTVATQPCHCGTQAAML